MISNETFFEILRFGVVGVVSTVLNYAIYWVLQHWIEVNIAYTTGYVLSLLVNYWLTAHFTFRKQMSAKNGFGFSGVHLLNYSIHIVLFNSFLCLGFSRAAAPIGVFAVAIPVNFILVRYVFRRN